MKSFFVNRSNRLDSDAIYSSKEKNNFTIFLSFDEKLYRISLVCRRSHHNTIRNNKFSSLRIAVAAGKLVCKAAARLCRHFFFFSFLTSSLSVRLVRHKTQQHMANLRDGETCIASSIRAELYHFSILNLVFTQLAHISHVWRWPSLDSHVSSISIAMEHMLHCATISATIFELLAQEHNKRSLYSLHTYRARIT